MPNLENKQQIKCNNIDFDHEITIKQGTSKYQKHEEDQDIVKDKNESHAIDKSGYETRN